MNYSIKKFRSITALFLLFCILSIFPVINAQAHPHSWVDLKTNIIGDETHILGFKMSWTFDVMTSAYMLDGEDLSEENKSKTLATIASDIMRNLSKADYFTFFYDDKTPIENGDAEQGIFTFNKGKLQLDFYLPLSQPHKINHRPLNLFVFEAAYYVDMSWSGVSDITLSPELSKHCSLELILPNPTAKQFSYAMSLPADADPDYELGQVFSQSVNILCNK